MPPASPTKSSERHPATRCVLLRPVGVPTPPELLASLGKRGIIITDCTDAFAAMAQVCLLEHSPPDRVIFLLVFPSQVPETPEILDAAARYAPHAACWWYDSRTSEKLRRVTPQDIVAWRGAGGGVAAGGERGDGVGGVGARSGPRAAPALRLTSDGEVPPVSVTPQARGNGELAAALNGQVDGRDEGADDGEPRSLTPGTLLTNEELAMLLSDPHEDGGPDSAASTGTNPASQGRSPWWRRPDSGGER